MALVFAMVLGADSIDDCEILRAGRTRRLLGGWMPAPSTLGTFLRAFTFGHVRQLDALLGEALVRAWRAGAGPGRGTAGDRRGQLRRGGVRPSEAGRRLRVHEAARVSPDPRHPRGHAGGAAHPSAQGIGEHAEGDAALHRGADRPRRSRRRQTGSSCCVRTPGSGTTRCSGAWRRPAGPTRSACACRRGFAQAVEAIEEQAWQKVEDYPPTAKRRSPRPSTAGGASIVSRTRLLGAQAKLWPDWRHFCFITNRSEDIALVEAEHRDHAVVEQVIADLKDQALQHFPSGEFDANGAWTVLGALAHNMIRWTQLIGLPKTHPPRCPDAAPPMASDRRAAHPPRPILDAAPARPLALAGRLPRRARPDQGAARRLTPAGAFTEHEQPLLPSGTLTPTRKQRQSAPHPLAAAAFRPQATETPAHTPNPPRNRQLTQSLGGSRLSRQRRPGGDARGGRPSPERHGPRARRLAHLCRRVGPLWPFDRRRKDRARISQCESKCLVCASTRLSVRLLRHVQTIRPRRRGSFSEPAGSARCVARPLPRRHDRDDRDRAAGPRATRGRERTRSQPSSPISAAPGRAPHDASGGVEQRHECRALLRLRPKGHPDEQLAVHRRSPWRRSRDVQGRRAVTWLAYPGIPPWPLRSRMHRRPWNAKRSPAGCVLSAQGGCTAPASPSPAGR